MREKELRLAQVCYGGFSLAICMHGVSKEVLKLARASADDQSGTEAGERGAFPPARIAELEGAAQGKDIIAMKRRAFMAILKSAATHLEKSGELLAELRDEISGL